jgi:MFS family permease
VALAAIVLQNAAIGGAWDYVDRLASQHHFPPEMSGIAVSGGLVVQVLGALAAAAWGRRLSFRWTLIVGTLCQAAVIGWLAVAATPLMYVLPALLFGLFWLALSPFQVRLLIAIDPSRTVAMLVTAAALVGLSIGPSVSALGVSTGDVTGAFWIASAMMLGALGLYAGLALRRMTETFAT